MWLVITSLGGFMIQLNVGETRPFGPITKLGLIKNNGHGHALTTTSDANVA